MDKVYEIVGHQIRFKLNGEQVEIDLRQAIWPVSTFSAFYMLFFKKSGFNNETLKKLEKQSDTQPLPDEKGYSPKEVVSEVCQLQLNIKYENIN